MKTQLKMLLVDSAGAMGNAFGTPQTGTSLSEAPVKDLGVRGSGKV